jgi:glycosyltransferase involved in cell wall biosynthesis
MNVHRGSRSMEEPGESHRDVSSKRLAVVSSTSRLASGGLSAYVASLTRIARDNGCETCNVVRFEADGRRVLDPRASEGPRVLSDGLGEIRVVAPDRGRASLRFVRPAMHRPPLQRLAVSAFTRAYLRPVAAAVPHAAQAVHAVGAGWELLGFPAVAAARSAGLPVTVLPAIHTGQWGDSTLDARLYRAADAVFALSRHEASRMEEIGVPPERIVVSPLGPSVGDGGDGARFRARHGLEDRPIVLFVGRKQRYKGFAALCEAIPAVLEAVPHAVLVAVGHDGGESTPLPPLAAYVDLGAASDEEKTDAIAACDAYCMPSVGESFGIAYVDAWAYGKPVIAGPAPAPGEMVADSGGGLVVEQDPREIAAALVVLLGDPGRARSLGEQGRAHQRRHWTWARVWERHVGAWVEAAPGPS